MKRTNLSTGTVTEYQWDHRNRLILVTELTSTSGTVTQVTEFHYDAFDRKTAKRVDSDGDGDWDVDEAYIWADGQVVLRLEDSDGEGTSDSFRIASRYFWGFAVDQLLADEQYASGAGPLVSSTAAFTTQGTTLWALSDHLGSVRDWTIHKIEVSPRRSYCLFCSAPKTGCDSSARPNSTKQNVSHEAITAYNRILKALELKMITSVNSKKLPSLKNLTARKMIA